MKKTKHMKTIILHKVSLLRASDWIMTHLHTHTHTYAHAHTHTHTQMCSHMRSQMMTVKLSSKIQPCFMSKVAANKVPDPPSSHHSCRNTYIKRQKNKTLTHTLNMNVSNKKNKSLFSYIPLQTCTNTIKVFICI